MIQIAERYNIRPLAMKVQCPKWHCRADIGQPCTGSKGQVRKQIHAVRYIKAKEKLK